MSNTKLQRIKTMLSELLELEMASATTDKGIIYWNDDELAEGTTVYVQDDNDIKVLAEDGEYEFDGKVIKVVEGKVTEITDKIVPVEIVPVETEPEVADNPETEEDETPELEKETEETPEAQEEAPEEVVEEPTEEEKPEDDPTTEEDETPEMEEEANDVAALVAEIETLKSEIEVLKTAIEELKGKPLAMSAVEQLENLRKEDKAVKGVARYASAIAEIRKN